MSFIGWKKIRLLVFAFVFKGDSCFLELRERLGDYKAFSANKKQGTGVPRRASEGRDQFQCGFLWLHYTFFSFTLAIAILGFPGGSDGKESACKAGDLVFIRGWGRSPGEGNGYPLRILSFMDSGAWEAIVHRVAKSWHDWMTFTNTAKAILL